MTEKKREHKYSRAQIFNTGNTHIQRGQKSANMLQCGSKNKYFGGKQYEIGKVCRKRRKTILSRETLLAKIYVRIWDANRRN